MNNHKTLINIQVQDKIYLDQPMKRALTAHAQSLSSNVCAQQSNRLMGINIHVYPLPYFMRVAKSSVTLRKCAVSLVPLLLAYHAAISANMSCASSFGFLNNNK